MLIVPPSSPESVRGRSAARPLLLRGPRLPDGHIADVVVAGGVIVSVGEIRQVIRCRRMWWTCVATCSCLRWWNRTLICA